jgi:hypothetical protein
MAQQLVAKNRSMKERHESTKRMNYRQSTMTQEFDAVADRSVAVEPLPPLPEDWIRIWDNPNQQYYFYDTIHHDICKDLVYVHAKVALKAAKLAEEEIDSDLSEQEDFVACPDDVCSSTRNTIISPDHVTSKSHFRSVLPGNVETTHGGYVDMSKSSEDEKENEVDDDDDSSTDLDSKPVAASKRGNKKRKIPEVETQDLPSTEDFGGAEALVNLQTEEEPEFAEETPFV